MVRDIQAHFQEVYGVEVSGTFISQVTNEENTHFSEMLALAKKRGVMPEAVVMDAWYSIA